MLRVNLKNSRGRERKKSEKEEWRQQTLLYISRFPTAIFYRKVRGYTDHLYDTSSSRKNGRKEHREQTPFPNPSLKNKKTWNSTGK